MAERLGVAFTTAQRAIDRLVAIDVVEQVGDAQRNRVYCAGVVLELLEEEPRFANHTVV